MKVPWAAVVLEALGNSVAEALMALESYGAVHTTNALTSLSVKIMEKPARSYHSVVGIIPSPSLAPWCRFKVRVWSGLLE